MARIKNLILKHKWQLMLFILFGSIAASSLLWFKNGTIIYFHDEIIPLHPANAVSDYLNMWRQNVDLGTASAGGIPKLISFIIFFLLSNLHISLQSIEKIFYVSIIFLAGIGTACFYLFLSQKKNKVTYLSASVAGLFYVLSPFIVEYVWRLNYIITRGWYYAFVPFFLIVCLCVFKSSIRSTAFYFYIFLFSIFSILISPSFSHPAFFIIALLLIALMAIVAKFSYGLHYSRTILYAIFLFCILAISNAYWLIPRFVTAGSEYANAESIGTLNSYLFNSGQLSLLQSFFLGDAPSMHDHIAWYSWTGFYRSVAYTIAGLILFVVSLPALFAKNKAIKIIAIGFLVMFPFYLGSLEPFSTVKILLFNKVATLQAFRDPGKWGFFLLPLLAIAIAYGFQWILLKIKLTTIKIAFLGTIFASLMVIGWPFWSGNAIPKAFNYPAAQVKIPADYSQAAKILSDNIESPIIQLPLHGSHNYATWSNGSGYKSVDILRNLSSQPLLDTNVNFQTQEILKEFQQRMSDDTLDQSSINNIIQGIGSKYIVINKDSDPKFVNPINYSNVTKELSENPHIRVAFSSNDISIYEYTLAQPKIFSPSIDYSLNQNTNFSLSQISNFSDWQYVGPKSADKGYDGNKYSIDMTNLNLNQVGYLKNISPLYIDPDKTSYLQLAAPVTNQDYEIAVSAEDINGYSSWLPNVTASINKNLSKSSDKLSNAYSLSGFSKPITYLRINIVKKSLSANKVQLYGISKVVGITNTYTQFSKNNTTQTSYINGPASKTQYSTAKITNLVDRSSSEYDFNLSGRDTVLIAAHQQQDNGWSITSSQGKILSKYFTRLDVDADQGAWVINLKELCHNTNLCSANGEVFSVDLKLIYSPQKLVPLGIGLSLASVIITGLTVLVVLFVKKKRHNEDEV